MLRYLEAKFKDHPKKMVSSQSCALPVLPSKEEKYSLVDPTKEGNESTSTPYAP